MYMDPEFNVLDRIITGTDINTAAARDHVPEVEHQIQVIKERMHAIHGGLPYNRMASQMIIELGKYVVMMLDAFPPKIGISQTYMPRTIMTGNQLDFTKKCKCPFGAYVKAYDDHDTTNTMIGRTQCAICLL